MDLLDSMQEIGVRIDTLMSELGPGQFEVTFDVAEGIEVNFFFSKRKSRIRF